jgi:hypothetical protein
MEQRARLLRHFLRAPDLSGSPRKEDLPDREELDSMSFIVMARELVECLLSNKGNHINYGSHSGETTPSLTQSPCP